MAKRTPNYALILVLFALSTCITYWARTRPVIAAANARLDSIPTAVGEWAREGKDYTPGKDVLDGWLVTPDNFLSRTYVDEYGTQMVLMVVYKGRDRRGWHLSEMCFSGSGYNVEQSTTTVPYAGRDIDAVKLVAEDQNFGDQQVAVYWLAQGRETESSFWKQQAQMALSRLRPSTVGWAFIRVTSPVMISEEETMDRIRDFVRVISGPLLGALTGGREDVQDPKR